jgi:hypothetical protein
MNPWEFAERTRLQLDSLCSEPSDKCFGVQVVANCLADATCSKDECPVPLAGHTQVRENGNRSGFRIQMTTLDVGYKTYSIETSTFVYGFASLIDYDPASSAR